MAYLVERRAGRPHPGDYGDIVRSQMVEIKLTINDYCICMAHRMVDLDGMAISEPDPKYFYIDDLRIYQHPNRLIDDP